MRLGTWNLLEISEGVLPNHWVFGGEGGSREYMFRDFWPFTIRTMHSPKQHCWGLSGGSKPNVKSVCSSWEPAAILIYIVWSPLKKIELICWPCTDFLCGFSVAHERVFPVCRACLPPAKRRSKLLVEGQKDTENVRSPKRYRNGSLLGASVFKERGVPKRTRF